MDKENVQARAGAQGNQRCSKSSGGARAHNSNNNDNNNNCETAGARNPHAKRKLRVCHFCGVISVKKLVKAPSKYRHTRYATVSQDVKTLLVGTFSF